MKNEAVMCFSYFVAGGDVRGDAGNGALRESLFDLQRRQCYRNRPHGQNHDQRRPNSTFP